MNLPRLHVIACPVFQRELELLSASAPAKVTLQFLDMGLHEGAADNLRAALQAAIDAVKPDSCDTIGLAYGLCNRGIVGLQARELPVIVPRAHDCIGMLLGGTQPYLAQLESQPGTYFQSAGWLEHLPPDHSLRQQNLLFAAGFTLTREELVARYGADNAAYLLEQFSNATQHYERLAFISTPVPKAQQWEAAARQMAQARGWKFERLAGDLAWLQRLLNAEWSEKLFLTLKPGERIALVHDGRLIAAEPA